MKGLGFKIYHSLLGTLLYYFTPEVMRRYYLYNLNKSISILKNQEKESLFLDLKMIYAGKICFQLCNNAHFTVRGCLQTI